jgi:hypothetical protein
MPRHCWGVWPAFPTSDYYGGSVPSHDQQPTAGLPATGLDSRRGGRSQDGSHVHHQPVDGVGAQLFPGSLATGTPQTFPVASWPATSTGVRVALPRCWSSVRCCPAPIRQISSRFLSCGGSTTGSCNTCTFPSCLPGPGRLAVPTRPVVVGAAPTLPCASRVRLPPASPGRYDSPEVGLSSHPVKWRLVAHEVVEKLLTSITAGSGLAFGQATSRSSWIPLGLTADMRDQGLAELSVRKLVAKACHGKPDHVTGRQGQIVKACLGGEPAEPSPLLVGQVDGGSVVGPQGSGVLSG